MMQFRYTEEHIEFLRQNITGTSYKGITKMFNDKFGTNKKVGAISTLLERHNLTNGKDAHFTKGQKPWNKGMKGLDLAGENGKKTQFKKGQSPINYRPVGSERLTKDGYVEVKVADPGKWKLKHVVTWEKANGKAPKGHAIIFGDGNRTNVSLDNLILVSRKQLAVLNKNHLIQRDANLTRTGILVADLYSKINERKAAK